MLRLLLGFERPQSGAIYYDGQDLASLDVRGFDLPQRSRLSIRYGQTSTGVLE